MSPWQIKLLRETKLLFIITVLLRKRRRKNWWNSHWPGASPMAKLHQIWIWWRYSSPKLGKGCVKCPRPSQEMVRKRYFCHHGIPYHTIPYHTIPYHTMAYASLQVACSARMKGALLCYFVANSATNTHIEHTLHISCTQIAHILRTSCEHRLSISW